MSFDLERFDDYLSFERGLSPRTLDAYARDTARLEGFLRARGIDDPGAATPIDLREFTYHLRDQGLAPTSIRRTLSGIRTYFGFLLAEGLIDADPSEQLEPPKTWRRLPDVLGRAEVDRLLEAPDQGHRLYWRDRAILEFAYASGVRVSELTGAEGAGRGPRGGLRHRPRQGLGGATGPGGRRRRARHRRLPARAQRASGAGERRRQRGGALPERPRRRR